MLLITTKDRPIADNGDDEDNAPGVRTIPCADKSVSDFGGKSMHISHFPLIETANPEGFRIMCDNRNWCSSR